MHQSHQTGIAAAAIPHRACRHATDATGVGRSGHVRAAPDQLGKGSDGFSVAP